MKWLKGFTWVRSLTGFSILAGLFSAAPALAATLTTGIEEGGAFQQALGLGTGDIRIIIANLIRIFLGLLGVIAVSLIVYGGFLWMTSAGNEERVQKAKMVIVNAIVGLVIIMMSYIIVAFVLGRLLAAIGYTGGTDLDDPECEDCLPPDYDSVFTIDTVSPQGDQTIKNLTIRLTFNQNVDETTVADQLTIAPTAGGANVEGVFTVEGDRVRFRPSALCEGYTDQYCFDGDTAYTITFESGLKSADGLTISCGGLYDSCTYNFTSGNLVDTTAPTVEITYPEYDDSISVDALVPLQAHVEDSDGGVSEVEFYVDGVLIDTVQPDGDTPFTYDAEINWDTSDLVELQRYALTAIAYDVNDHSTESNDIRVTARAAHCFNGDYPTSDASFPDYDEEGEDCGGADCGICGGDSCGEDSECQSGECTDGVCVDSPVITGVSPGSGAVGTYVSVSGENFGSIRGSVMFGDVTADFADCDDSWSNDQVIVLVPEGLNSGSAYTITLTTYDGNVDTTQDDNGSLIPDFEVDTVTHPGICSLTPSSGEVESIVTVSGANFGDTQSTSTIYFDSTAVNAYTVWQDDHAKATVPTLNANDYSVSLWVNGVSSNEVDFTVVDSDAESAPVISTIDPSSGPIGQYVTITGSGFGSSPDLVYFTNNDPESENYGVAIVGDVDFPAACTDGYWAQTQIIVKVPEQVDETAYLISVRKDDQTSNGEDFTVTSGEPSPGVCSLSPDSGPNGLVDVTLSGEGFGSNDGGVVFYEDAAAEITSWSDEEAVIVVPDGAITGPVVLLDSDETASNEINFEVGNCNQTDFCDANTEQCCASGQCLSTTQTCPETVPISAEYVWKFSTGPIPVVPTIQIDCSDAMISPTPWSERAGGSDVCVNAGISATFDVNMDSSTLKAAGAITLGKCNDVNCATTTSVSLGSVLTTDASFTVYPAVSLDASTLYQVTLASTVASSVGVAMPQTSWTFTTSSDGDDCAYAGVSISPDSDTIEELNGYATYNARVLAADACIILNSENVDWSWSLDPSAGRYASFADSYSSTCTGEPSACQVVQGVAEGDSILTAEESTQGLDDDADVLVNFTNPYAVDYWPGCATGGTACINGAIGAEFNTNMDDVTAEAIGAVHLYACSDESCTNHTDDIAINVTRSDANQAEINITLDDKSYAPTGTLQGHTYYQVVFSGDIESQSGVPLSEYYHGDFDWTFLTRDTDEECSVGSVVMNPASSTATYVGQTSIFDSVPYSDPDSCAASGERLTAEDYDWAWAVEEELVASLWRGGQTEVHPEQIPDGCTTSCLPEGTESYVAICGVDADGDGNLIDPGEDCDNGTGIAGSGCSASCLTMGTSACASSSGSSCCGNGTKDTGEECDDANTDDADGCSSACLNEGEQGGKTTCGDGVVTHLSTIPSTGTWAGGEDCDYASSDDNESVGCSESCLYEGSTSTVNIVGVCGDGEIDAPAEQCDDGETNNGDGCSEHCLFEGSVACADPATEPYCCGNGRREVVTSESCDDGNAESGDGCSSVCLLEGSSASYSEPSWCGDGEIGTGEVPATSSSPRACEISSTYLEGSFSPEQVTVIAATAPAEVNDEGLATTVVTATADGATGEAALNLSCSCESDSDCSDSSGSVTLGCGVGSCCYERPNIDSITPSAPDACRNALISMDFDSAMALPTFTDNVTVALTLESDEECPYSSSLTSGAFNTSGNLFTRAWNTVQHFFGSLVGSADAASDTCLLPVSFTSSEITGGERVSIIYTQLLEADHTYTLTVAGDPDRNGSGVRTVTDVGLESDATYTLQIGDDVCSFDAVQIEDTNEDSSGLFTVIAEEHDFTATAITVIGGVAQAIMPIEDVYDWDWAQTWWSTDETVLTVPETGVDTDTESTNTVTAVGENGTASIYASATVTADTLFDPSTVDDVVYGSSEVTANLCENLWPARVSRHAWTGFEDTAGGNRDPDADGVNEIAKAAGWTHFTTSYCRDAGDAGIAGDYPAADVVAVEEPPSDVFKEYLFKLDGGDAIGIRIATNDDLLSIEDWYADQAFTGSPASTTVDGYQALTDGRTTYVSAANVSGATSGTIYPNIYVLSYNEDASEETIAIFNQMLENWEFNNNLDNDELCYESSGEPTMDADGNTTTCTSDLDCSSGDCRADKDKLQRDMIRLTDLKQIAGDLDDYGEEHGRCSATTSTSCTSDDDCPGVESCEPLYPTIDSGSFLRQLSSSAWDSWQTVVGTELGVTLPTDPLNAYESCGDAGGTYADYLADTCWYEAAAQYVCPTGSHVYNYKNIGGTTYNVWADLEFDYVSGTTEWYGSVDGDYSDDLSIVAGQAFLDARSGFQALPTCNGSVMGSSATCGDGVIGSSETCEVGETSTIDCTALTCVSADPDYDGLSCIIDCDDATICAGGDSNDNGVCDSGAASHQACGTGSVDCTDTAICSTFERTAGAQATHCDATSCTAYDVSTDAACVPYRCGNGVVDDGESCDDGSHNGDYGYCGTSCAWDDTAFYCGDGTLAGGEICDLGALNSVYNVSASLTCNATCDGSAGYCGDAEITNAEVCDGSESWAGDLCFGGDDDLEPCESDSDCDSGQCGSGYFCSLASSVSCSDAVYACEPSAEATAGTLACTPTYECDLFEQAWTEEISCTGPTDTTTCGTIGSCEPETEGAAEVYACGLAADTSNPYVETCTGTDDTTTCTDGMSCGEYASGSYACFLPFPMDGCGSAEAFSTDESVCPAYDGNAVPCTFFNAELSATYTCQLSDDAMAGDLSCESAADTTTCGDLGTCDQTSSTCGDEGDCVEDTSGEGATSSYTGYACALPPDLTDPYGSSCTGLDDTSCPMADLGQTYCGEYSPGAYACFYPTAVPTCDSTTSTPFSTDASVCPPLGAVSIACGYFDYIDPSYVCEMSADALAGGVECEGVTDTATCGDWGTCGEFRAAETCGDWGTCADGACAVSSEISCTDLTDVTTCQAYDSGLECSGAGSDYGSCGTGTVCEDFDDAGESCTSDTNCGAEGQTCDDGICSSAEDMGEYCNTDSTCDSEICSSFVYDLTRSRGCNATCLATDAWGDCERADQSCGNGEVDGDEECDDGNDSNNDSCSTLCTNNVCGDGYLYTDYESCDRGSENGETCEADYGSTCRYCSYDCTYLTSSSAYCGDEVLDEPQEFCDASVMSQYYCFDADSGDIGDVCYEEGTTSECEDDYTCRSVGVCNGGADDNEYCTSQNSDAVIRLWDYATDCETDPCDTGEGGPEVGDLNACGSGGTCVLPTCADDCNSTCPSSYSNETVEVISEEAGAVAQRSINLYSSESGDSPNLASLTLPACELGNSIVANVSDADRDYANVNVMFIVDDSQSMGTALGDSTRLEVLNDVVNDAIDQLYDAYHSVDAEMRIGYTYIGGTHGTDSSGNGAYETSELKDFATDFGTDEYFLNSDSQADLVTSITSRLSTVYSVTGTPLIQVLRSAQSAFANDENVGTDDKNIIVLFSDGDIRQSGSEEEMVETVFELDVDSTAADLAQEYERAYVEAVSELIDDIQIDDIDVYSATFGSSGSCAAYEGRRWSSMSCEEEDRGCATDNQWSEGNYRCTAPSNNITYAYASTTADGMAEMYQSIIDAILDVTVTITDSDGNSSTDTVDVGDAIELPLPSLFVCDDEAETTAQIEVTFTGEGSIAFSSIELNMCAPNSTASSSSGSSGSESESESETESESESESGEGGEGEGAEEVIACGDGDFNGNEVCAGFRNCLDYSATPADRDLNNGVACETADDCIFGGFCIATESLGQCDGGVDASGQLFDGVPCMVSSTFASLYCGYIDTDENGTADASEAVSTNYASCVSTLCEADCTSYSGEGG